MKYVRKSAIEPPALTTYKEKFAGQSTQLKWDKFKKNSVRRDAVRDQLRDDQRGLCAYCENTVFAQDESVEHLVPRSAGLAHELDWNNLVLCCLGGERPISEDVPDAAVRYDTDGSRSCGHAKKRHPCPVVNPRSLPVSPRLFRFSSEDGRILCDEAACMATDVAVEDVETAIVTCGLRAGRLNRARLAVINALEEMLEKGDTERQIAEDTFPADGYLPAFFTTIRWYLGQDAEAHLQSVNFAG